ncbi:LOW QUALITY PROTEIN: hypothetical protein ACHAW6_004586 [Cyclotella cf. meneghiniana]
MSIPTYTTYKTPYSLSRWVNSHCQLGNKYIMVTVEIDSSTILVEPLKNRTDIKLTHAYSALMLRLK